MGRRSWKLLPWKANGRREPILLDLEAVLEHHLVRDLICLLVLGRLARQLLVTVGEYLMDSQERVIEGPSEWSIIQGSGWRLARHLDLVVELG